MKNVTPIVLAAAITLSAFSSLQGNALNDDLIPAEVAARALVTALRSSSEAKFVALFPTLPEFHRQMDQNAWFYGANLDAAKKEFTKTYNEELLSAVRRAYASVVEEGEKRGINWSEVSVVSVIPSEDGTTIVFDNKGKTFNLFIERSLVIEGRFRISQYLKFI